MAMSSALDAGPVSGGGTGPRVVSVRNVVSQPESLCEWHSHPYEELCLTADDGTSTGMDGERVEAPINALGFYGRGVKHGYWNSGRQAPRFWVVHFTAGPELSTEMPFLGKRERRLWPLAPAQAATFKELFMRLFLEHSRPRLLSAAAETAWLRLLLIEVQRWADACSDNDHKPLLQESANTDLLRMWQLINETVPVPGGLAKRLEAELPNYDSLRHGFKATFGLAPKQLLLRLRMQQAKELLVRTRLSVKEIATHVGYEQQHELARAFRRHVGTSPTEWRSRRFAEQAVGSPTAQAAAAT